MPWNWYNISMGGDKGINNAHQKLKESAKLESPGFEKVCILK